MKKLLFIISTFLIWAACSNSDELEDIGNEGEAEANQPIITQLDSIYIVSFGEKIQIDPKVETNREVQYSWSIGDKKIAETPSFSFEGYPNGIYTLVFEINEGSQNIVRETIKIVVTNETFHFTTECNKLLTITLPEHLEAQEEITWKILNAKSERHRLSVIEGEPLFVATDTGTYQIEATAGEICSHITIQVNAPSQKQTPYFAKVFDYNPAPGQFVNELPPYEEGDTYKDMLGKVGDWLIGDDTYMITLGGWGGSVTLGFDHTIVNVKGKCDFRVNGNAFGSNKGRPDAPFGGSCEPGIIMVAYDKNKNGQPDEDEWYEIKGSGNFSSENEPWYSFSQEYGNDLNVYRNYEMTYYRPESEENDTHGEVDNPLSYVSIQNYIQWEDNQGGKGYKVKNVYHQQSYYPAWLHEDKLTFRGIRLSQNALNEGEYVPGINAGNVYYVLYAFRYGYVDNHPNLNDLSAIDIDWAIDKDGNKVALPGIDFIKIYNGINQENGWLGECSTEVDKGMDLHMLGYDINTIKE